MTSLTLSQVRRRVAGSLASPFQKLLIQSTFRVLRMSSNTARTSGLAALSSISGTVGIVYLSGLAPAQLAGQPAGEEQPEHAKIAYQRPDRMGKSFRPVAFERRVGNPGRAIP